MRVVVKSDVKAQQTDYDFNVQQQQHGEVFVVAVRHPKALHKVRASHDAWVSKWLCAIDSWPRSFACSRKNMAVPQFWVHQYTEKLPVRTLSVKQVHSRASASLWLHLFVPKARSRRSAASQVARSVIQRNKRMLAT